MTKEIAYLPPPDESHGELTLMESLSAAGLCVLFGANAVAIKVTLSGLGAFTSAGLRFALAAVTIAAWAVASGRKIRMQLKRMPPLLLLAVLFWAQLSLFYNGLARTHAARGVLLVNLLPFFILLFSGLFKQGEKLALNKWIGILLGFCGVVLLFAQKTVFSASLHRGDIMVLLATLLWSFSTLYTKHIIRHYRPYEIVFYQMMFSAPLFLGAAFLFDRPMIEQLNHAVVGAFVYQTWVTASFGFIAWNNLLKRQGAVALHTFVFIMPVAGVILSGLILKESMQPNLLLAMVFIVAGIMIVQFGSRREVLKNKYGSND